MLAAKNLGDEAYNNFLDHTFLGDRKTTIRQYLATTGSGIMEEEPPESLKSRYGGWLRWWTDQNCAERFQKLSLEETIIKLSLLVDRDGNKFKNNI